MKDIVQRSVDDSKGSNSKDVRPLKTYIDKYLFVMPQHQYNYLQTGMEPSLRNTSDLIYGLQATICPFPLDYIFKNMYRVYLYNKLEKAAKEKAIKDERKIVIP